MITNKRSGPIAERLLHRSPALASLARVLSSCRSDHPGRSHGLHVDFAATPIIQRPCMLRLRCRDGVVEVVFDLAAHPALGHIAAGPREQSAALATLWLSDLLAHFSDAGVSMVVEELRSDNAPLPIDGLCLSYEWSGLQRWCLVVHLPEQLPTHLERQWHAPGRAHDRLGDLRLPGTLRLRSRPCSSMLLASLEPGDVLLGWRPNSVYTPGSTFQNALIYWGARNGVQLRARVRVEHGSIFLESPLALSTDLSEAQLDNIMDPISAESAGDIDVTPVGALEVPVHVEIMAMNLSVDQLHDLGPGYALDLPLALNEATVRLVSYGQTLGFGRLVAIGDHFGVEIKKMASRDERSC